MGSEVIEQAIGEMHVLQEHNENDTIPEVTIRLIFLRIGKLDTQEGKFQAHVAIEARWFPQDQDEEDKVLSLLSKHERHRLQKGETIKLPKDFSEEHWYPQLFLLNIAPESGQTVKYSVRKSRSRLQIREFRDVHGVFYSKFDLHYFPTDVQELNVSIGSALFDNEVTLIVDPSRASGINREAFVDQQEWHLYDHVETRTKFLKGFLFQNDDDDELDTPGHVRKRSILIISCHAARRARYFYWNGFCLIFLITMIAFSSFAIPISGVPNRIHITCTLLLTSIAFRWTIGNSLPNISYLTVIDRYTLVSIFLLISLCIWHSIIGTFAVVFGDDKHLSSNFKWTSLDRIVFVTLTSLYIIAHLVMGGWYYSVPIARKRQMRELDRQYRQTIDKILQRRSLPVNQLLKCTTNNHSMA